MGELTRAVLVTGAASGIGAALAEELGRRGTPVVLCDVDSPGLERVREKIGSRMWAVTADVTKSDDVERMTAEARALAGPMAASSTVRGSIR